MAADKCLHIVYSIHHVPRTYLWQLLCNVSPHKHSFQVDPEVLDYEPIFNEVRGVGELLHPQGNLFLEGSIVPATQHIVTSSTGMHTCTPMLNYKSMFQLPMWVSTSIRCLFTTSLRGASIALRCRPGIGKIWHSVSTKARPTWFPVVWASLIVK